MTQHAASGELLSQGRIRRARCLVAYWEEGQFVLENYLTNKQTTVDPLVTHLLQEVNDYQAKLAVQEHFGSIPCGAEIVEVLIGQDVLVVEKSPLDKKERLVEGTWSWDHAARYFHYSTQHTVFEDNLEAEGAELASLARRVPPPSPFKDYGRSDVTLRGSFEERSSEFWNVLRARRTKRRFAREPISLEDFSSLLLWTWGRTLTIKDPEIGEYILKTSPSGGARHPVEVYPVVLRVNGAKPGIYHYSVERHELETLRLGDFEDLVARLCANQVWVQDAAAVFFMTAVLPRSMWKYKHAHAYRVILLDAGHLGQTFHLVCTKLGLAPFTSAATQDSAIESALGLDGVSEIPVYTAATGIPWKDRRKGIAAVK